MSLLLIRGGRVIDPSRGLDSIGDVLVQDGRIVRAGGATTGPADQEIDAAGLVVSPGFVDLHTHLRFPGLPHKETLITGTEAAAAGGFTTICAMANTRPVVDTPAMVEQVLEAAAREARVRVRQLAAVTYGLAGDRMTDFSALAEAGAVAFSDDGKPVWNQAVMRRALEESNRVGKPISVHEEDQTLVGEGVANAGPRARRLGLTEWPCAGEAAMVVRDLALLEQSGGYLHVAHVSCAETVELVRAARQRGLAVSAEVTPHHLRLTDALLEGNQELALGPAHPRTKVNPPLRSEEDVEAMVEALADGTLGAIATDHAPHSDEDKTGAYHEAAFGISAIETALPLALDLVRQQFLDLSTLIMRLTLGPARIFGLDAGTLDIGAPADICIFDPEERWTVEPGTLRSQGKNTPLLGAEMVGRVRYTLVNGRVVHGST